MIRPDPSPSARADELAIAAMAKTLRSFSDHELGDMRLRAEAYLESKIPLNDIFRLDMAALKVECARRDAFEKLRVPLFAETAE